MMKVTAILALLISSFGSSLGALDSDIQTALAGKYEHTTVILRHPVHSNHQRYSASGALLSSGKDAPWTVAGAIEISRVQVTSQTLTIEGRQQILAFDEKRKAMVPFNVKDKNRHSEKIEITLDKPLQSADDAETIMHRIFAMNDTELIDSVPYYWRSFLHKQDKARQPVTRGQPTAPVEIDSSKEMPSRDMEKIYHVDGKTVKPPKPVFTPEPSFSVEAKQVSFQGVVVLSAIIDSAGKVTRPQIVRPVGLGLDEKAIERSRIGNSSQLPVKASRFQ